MLQPELFLGGEMKLDREAALTALASVAEPLNMDSHSLAEGAYAIANTKIAAAVSAMTIDRGLDPREFSLFAYGAAGPMHAVAVARELGIEEVIVPYFPGGFSAYGMTASRSRVEYSKSVMTLLDGFDLHDLNANLAELAGRCREDLEQQGIAGEDVSLEYIYYGMYAGQGTDNRLILPGGELGPAELERVAVDFHDFYERRFGYRAPEIPIMVTSLVVVGYGPIPAVTLPEVSAGDADETSPERAIVLRAELRLDGVHTPDAPFYDRNQLREGDIVTGPAVVDDRLGTIVINPGARAHVEGHGTLRIEV
jgi:N-methylhydantoinase A